MPDKSSESPETNQVDKGHIAHTKEADSQQPLPGEMRGPIKLTMLGAGSGFTPRLVSDTV